MSFIRTSGRYYLSGIDCVMSSLNMLNKKHTGLGNHSQLVLTIKGLLDREKLGTRLNSILTNSSFFKGKVKRAWNLAPYWAPEHDEFHPKDLIFFNLESQTEESLNNLIQNCAKKPFKDENTLLGFDLIYFNNFSFLLMRFDHRMLDARGAEALLEQILNDKNQIINYNLPVRGAKLHSWKSRFLSGQFVNRFLRSIYSKELKIAVLNKAVLVDNSYSFYNTTFSDDQTKEIDTASLRKAGYLMNGVYILGCVVKSFDSIFKKNKSEGNILVPINVDIRETKFSSKKIFFNNVSFMFFNLKPNLPLTQYIKNLKTQFIDQIKNRVPYHIRNAALLLRILPIKSLASFLHYRMKKKPCSFSFSYISEQAFYLKYVQNLPVENLYHMPFVPIDPGVGVFFTRFNNRLNMTISTFDKKLNKDNSKHLEKSIMSQFNNGNNNEKI